MQRDVKYGVINSEMADTAVRIMTITPPQVSNNQSITENFNKKHTVGNAVKQCSCRSCFAV